MRLQEKVAIVTGGGGGLGAGIATCLAQQGARIAVCDIEIAAAERVAKELDTQGHEAQAFRVDVRDPEACRAMTDAVLDHFGRLDILVANAGVDGLPKDNPEAPPLVENILEQDWDLVMDVNLKGVFLSCCAVIPHFKQQKGGRIINISSVAGRQGLDLLPVYAASKAGVISLTQSIALQLAPYRVNVNCICPGIIWTPMWERLATYITKSDPAFADAEPSDAFNAVVQQMIPFGEPQSAEDIGNTAVFLASDEAREITAQSINVCGGIRMN